MYSPRRCCQPWSRHVPASIPDTGRQQDATFQWIPMVVVQPCVETIVPAGRNNSASQSCAPGVGADCIAARNRLVYAPTSRDKRALIVHTCAEQVTRVEITSPTAPFDACGLFVHRCAARRFVAAGTRKRPLVDVDVPEELPCDGLAISAAKLSETVPVAWEPCVISRWLMA